MSNFTSSLDKVRYLTFNFEGIADVDELRFGDTKMSMEDVQYLCRAWKNNIRRIT